MQEQVLLVEDDASLAPSIADELSDAGFTAAHTPAGAPREARGPRSIQAVRGRGYLPGDRPPPATEEDP
jgi:hypothetical protein